MTVIDRLIFRYHIRFLFGYSCMINSILWANYSRVTKLWYRFNQRYMSIIVQILISVGIMLGPESMAATSLALNCYGLLSRTYRGKPSANLVGGVELLRIAFDSENDDVRVIPVISHHSCDSDCLIGLFMFWIFREIILVGSSAHFYWLPIVGCLLSTLNKVEIGRAGSVFVALQAWSGRSRFTVFAGRLYALLADESVPSVQCLPKPTCQRHSLCKYSFFDSSVSHHVLHYMHFNTTLGSGWPKR